MSISISQMRSVIITKDWDASFRTYGPYSTMLTDTSFTDYHVFRAQSRILTDFTPAPDKPQ